MRVGILTYNVPNRKTQALVSLLALQEKIEISLHGLPFLPRPPRAPIYQHRPKQRVGPEPASLAAHFGIKYVEVKDPASMAWDFDVGLIGAAGILPAELVARGTIINSHPGLLPFVRGLDAFKWAIAEDKPLGCSLHTIDEKIDGGTLLTSVVTTIFHGDSFAELARRHYENEVALAANFLRFFLNPQAGDASPIQGVIEPGPAHKRMPKEIEETLASRFEEYVNRHATAREAQRTGLAAGAI
jgi:phosphoribosylglycinamide formyltransferase-1